MDNNEKEQLLAELGRTETVRDVERAYQGLVDRTIKVKRILARQKADSERARTELKLFLGEVSDITGLGFNSPLFWKIVARTLKLKELRQRLGEDAPYVPAFMEGWPDGEGSFGDLPGDGDIADALCSANPNLKKYRKGLI